MRSDLRGPYLDFELTLFKTSSGLAAKVTKSPAGTSDQIELPDLLDGKDLETVRLEVAYAIALSRTHTRGTAEEKVLRSFGQRIFDDVIRNKPAIAKLYDRCQAMASAPAARTSGVRLRLRIEAPELARLPWEFLYNSSDREYLSLMHRSPVVRNVEVGLVKAPLRVSGTLNVLGMISNPTSEDYKSIDSEQERRRIDRALDPHQKAGLVYFRWVKGETSQQLLAELGKAPWHIFHFIGHGGLSTPTVGSDPDDRPEGFLVFAKESGEPDPKSASDVKILLNNAPSLRLVVLNCCESATGTPTDDFASPAAALVRTGLPAVVAMQFPIGDEAAINMAGAFYDRLADNRTLEDAITYARQMIQQTSRTEWGIPVLFTGSQTGRLFKDIRPLPQVAMGAAPAIAGQNLDAQARLRTLFGV